MTKFTMYASIVCGGISVIFFIIVLAQGNPEINQSEDSPSSEKVPGNDQINEMKEERNRTGEKETSNDPIAADQKPNAVSDEDENNPSQKDLNALANYLRYFKKRRDHINQAKESIQNKESENDLTPQQELAIREMKKEIKKSEEDLLETVQNIRGLEGNTVDEVITELEEILTEWKGTDS